MESAFHFVFELFKIAALAAVYSCVILLLYRGFSREKYKKVVLRQGKARLWLKLYLLFYAGLFIFMFTYWGNHGLGDSAQIPVGHFTTMQNINWTAYATLDDREFSNGDPIQTTAFIVYDDRVLGNCESDFYSPAYKYFIYDLDSRDLVEFPDEATFTAFTARHKLPGSKDLKSFEENYSDYWRGWRFWLLP